jgi:acetylornithine deacetylase
LADKLHRPSREEVLDLLSELVRIDSVNPSLVPGAAGEGQIARFVARWLEEAGLEVRLEAVAPGRPNVVGRVPGSGGGRSLILNAHTDTVGAVGAKRPFEPIVEGDRLYGRGSYDMKAGLASVMLAARGVMRAGSSGDVIVTAVMDEEYASLGTQAVVDSITADAAIVTEPTGLRICAAHKGFAWLSVETHGRAAHGSKPELGVDAISHMGRVLGQVEELGRELSGREPHRLLGAGSIHASLIQGGTELSSYPDRCVCQIERRTVPGETAASVEAEMRVRLDSLRERDPTFAAKLDLYLWRGPFEVDPKETIVSVLRDAAVELIGHPAVVYGDTPWMDAALLQSAGIPTVVFGPGGAGAHAAVEYASIREVALCAEILTRTAMNFCAG